MNSWKEINQRGITGIEKCVAEFDVNMLNVPNGKYKVKIYEDQKGYFTGFTNIKIKSSIDGSLEGGVGYGNTIEEALELVIKNFIEMVKERENLTESDFAFVQYEYF